MKNSRTFGAKDIALIATFAALIAVSAIAPAIPVGGPVAITLQTFSVLLAGAVLGALRGFLSVVLYIAIGTLGVPIFAGGGAGIAPYFGPSVGYLVSMPFAAALIGFLTYRLRTKKPTVLFLAITGFALIATFLIIHPLGILGLSWRGEMDLTAAFVVNLAFIPGDLIKTVLVGIVAAAILRAFPNLMRKN